MPKNTPMRNTPITAAVTYSGLKPRSGMEMRRPTQRMMFRSTADPRPAVASANPASAPRTPEG